MCHTHHSIATLARRIGVVAAAAISLTAAAAGPAAAYQDLRSPDARDAGRTAAVDRAPTVDLRSPDARDAGSAATVDLRSPDARDATREPATPQVQPSPDGFEWIYLAAVLAGLVACGGVLATLRRTRGTERRLVASR